MTGVSVSRRSVERDGPRLRLTFDLRSSDGRTAVARVTANRAGVVLDLQTEGAGGFRAGTTGNPDVDVDLAERVADFARGRHAYRPVRRPR